MLNLNNKYIKEKSVILQLVDAELCNEIFGFDKDQTQKMAQAIANKLEKTPNLLEVIQWILEIYNENECIFQFIQFGAILWSTNFFMKMMGKHKPPVMAS